MNVRKFYIFKGITGKCKHVWETTATHLGFASNTPLFRYLATSIVPENISHLTEKLKGRHSAVRRANVEQLKLQFRWARFKFRRNSWNKCFYGLKIRYLLILNDFEILRKFIKSLVYSFVTLLLLWKFKDAFLVVTNSMYV